MFLTTGTAGCWTDELYMRSNRMRHYIQALAGILIYVGTSTTPLANTILFTEDFSDLSGWIGKNGGSHQGTVVTDPFDPANQVLSFSGLNVSGDIFTRAPLPVGGKGRTIISFDYLGLPSAGSSLGNLGGFIDISIDLAPKGGDAAWIAGTELSAVNGLGFTGIELMDNAQWQRYEIDITSILFGNNISSIYLMLEDWRDAGGIAGDAFFDNIEVITVMVPEIASTIFLLVGSVSILFSMKLSIAAEG